jgi:hypothetical protein
MFRRMSRIMVAGKVEAGFQQNSPSPLAVKYLWRWRGKIPLRGFQIL